MGKANVDWTKHSKLGLYVFVVFTLIASAFPMLMESKFNFDEYFTIFTLRLSSGAVIPQNG